MYSGLGASMQGFYGEGEAFRQQMLDKQRALLEQKKKQRQMQHGMMVAGGGRPTSSKSHRPTSSQSSTGRRPSTGSCVQCMDTSSGIKSPNFSKSLDLTTNLVPAISSDNCDLIGNQPKIKMVNILSGMEGGIDGDHDAPHGHLSPPHMNQQHRKSISSNSSKISSTSDDYPLLSVNSKPKPLTHHQSKSSCKSKPSNILGASTMLSRKTESTYSSHGISAAAKLQALGIAPSLDYDTDSSDDEIGGDEVLTNPGRQEEDEDNCPLQSESADLKVGLVSPQSGEAAEVPMQDFEKLSVILSPGGNTIENINAFVNSLAPDSMSIRCRVQRKKRGMERSMFPTYCLYLDRGESLGTLFLLAARKRKKSRSSNYLISTSADDLSRDGKNFVSKLRANFLGTSFTVYDNGVNPSSYSVLPDKSNLRQELVAILYETNVLGFKGPRKMTAVIPAVNYDHQVIAVQPTCNSETLLERWRSNQMTDLLQLHNKHPVWSDETQAFVLNFHGRVTQASVKNFQLVHATNANYIILQFGRISDDTFTLDYRFPLTALQAFSISLSSFDSKLACE